MADYKAAPQIGVSVDTGDRLVGAGVKDSNGKYALIQLDASGNVPTAIGAGSAIIGTVKIDQTTPGTTNGVTLNDIALSIKSIVNLLKDSLTIDPITGRLRVHITTSTGTVDTLTTVSTVGQVNNISNGTLSSVSTVTNLTQFAGYDIRQTLLFSNEYISWGTCVRSNIT